MILLPYLGHCLSPYCEVAARPVTCTFEPVTCSVLLETSLARVSLCPSHLTPALRY